MIDRGEATSAASPLIQRVPPVNLEAERAVLCSVLWDGEVMGNLVAVLKPEDFYRSGNRHIYEVMLALYDKGEPVLPVSVVEGLRTRGLLEKVGGSEYLADLAGAVDTPAHAEYFARLVREKAIARNLIHATSRIQQAAYEEAVSGAELLEQAEADIYELSKGREVNEVQGVDALIRETFDELEGGIVASGVRSGFTTFDDMTGGLKPGELVIVAGRPSMGKTTWALNIARHASSREGKTVAVFSLEMTARNIVRNILCAEARVDGKKMRQGRFLSDADHQRLRDAAGLLFDARLYVDDTPGLTPTLLRAKARRLKSRYGLDLVIIDYLQLMSGGPASRAQENRQQEISYISRSLKLLARELEVPVIALSQLNRAAEQREGNRPRLSDLRESGAIEQDADVICLLYRPEYYLSARADETRRAELAGKAEVIIGKQRNGPTGTVHLHFMKDWMRFDNPTAEAIP
ncbi:MAG: replicative DNA helicase [Planctomycetes bacterium]|nr:replicative DNA helicase [Planctomycetota bacterium]MCB9824896.1 replicative DNA helicase [Planctomycetota bacterium]MCB9830317.1 replicative DNA helicase [Planctomycetota bacterium]MCB9902165.1 replicative DNA helicase [Planctomycetota bacterium]